MPRSSPSDSCFTKSNGSLSVGGDPKDPNRVPLCNAELPNRSQSYEGQTFLSASGPSILASIDYTVIASPSHLSELSGAGTQILGPSNMAAPRCAPFVVSAWSFPLLVLCPVARREPAGRFQKQVPPPGRYQAGAALSLCGSVFGTAFRTSASSRLKVVVHLGIKTQIGPAINE